MKPRITLLAVVCDVHRGLFYFCVLVLGLYAIGNFQGFLDATQLMLLRVVRGAALLGVLFGLYAVAGRFLLQRRFIGALLWEALLLLGNAATFLVLALLLVWLQP